MNSENHLLFEVRDRVLYVTLNRPEKHNALSLALLSDLKTLFENYSDNKSLISAAITGSGTKTFAAGGDLRTRVADLEDRQDENDIEFVLVDRTLADLNARINTNDADIRAQDGRLTTLGSSVRDVEKRCKTLEAKHRDLVEVVKRLIDGRVR